MEETSAICGLYLSNPGGRTRGRVWSLMLICTGAIGYQLGGDMTKTEAYRLMKRYSTLIATKKELRGLLLSATSEIAHQLMKEETE